MKENNLLASVALFSQLYNNDNYNSVTDILGEFIKGVVVSERKWTVSSTELKHLLEEVYDFKIPESVIKTTVKNRLKEVAILKDGHYQFDQKIKNDFIKIDDAYNSIQAKQNQITAQLANYIESKQGKALTPQDKLELVNNFTRYLFDGSANERYSKFISAFIIANQATQEFTDSLNLIREGIILYQGVRYTSDINELGKWNTELTIYLSTEHLFNAQGYNGILFEQIFNDFYTLVNEINTASRTKSGEKLIQLKYFEETKGELDVFFQTAEYILKGTATLDTTKPAMKAILDGCKNPSDVKMKKVKFDKNLESMGIHLREFKTSIYEYHDYVVEDEQVLKELRKQSEERGRMFDEGLCRLFFKIFTKINYLRGGESKTNFERVGSLFITGNRFALFLAHNSKVKFGDEDIPFAKDIDYITSKFWFKLKKGFHNKATLPKSFDVITKAQIIISSLVNQGVYQEYLNLQKQVKSGALTVDQARQLSFDLRQKPTKPEEITTETIDNSLDFLTSDSYFDDLQREKQEKEKLLENTIKRNEELFNELTRRDILELEKKKRKDEAKRETEKLEYLKSNWHAYKKEQTRNLGYFLLVTILTILPIVIGLTLKVNSKLNNWIDSLGNNQYYIWSGLAFIFLSEILGRSYLFNKERIKLGWTWLACCINSSTMTKVKDDRFREFESKFNISH